jgi:hypothetical protein
MLVKFDSEAGQILMFGDVAVALLKMMGQSGVVPGAIVAPDIPSALEKLRQGVEAQAHHPRARRDDEIEDPDVTLRQRAVPLMELLDRAAKQAKNVMWTQER